MMTIHRVSAGDGYTYYTNEVASADERRDRKRELSDYYLDSGAPPGQWMGSGMKGHFEISGEVTEQQMRDLFGGGKRPDAQSIRDKKNGVVDERSLLLGNPYAVYPGFHKEFTEAVTQAINDWREDNQGAEPNRRERSQIRRHVARELFIADRQREPINDDELTRFLTTQTSTSMQAVAGFDLTFSVPKSVSVMWALGDKELRERIEAAHIDAIKDTLKWLEAEVIGSRVGRNGVRRVQVDGVMAARFRHYDSRAGDPQLHDHLVVSNKVFVPFGFKNDDGTPAGVWRTIDSKALYKATVASSTRYDNALMTRLNRDLGIAFEQRGGDGQALKMEASMVPEALVERFSTRRVSIKGRLDQLVGDYERMHGYRPGRVAMMRLAQRATLETRQAKDHTPLAERLDQWRRASDQRWTAAELDRVKDKRLARARREPTALDRAARLLRPLRRRRDDDAPPGDEEIAQRVVEALEERRSTWTLRHVQAEAARQLAAATGGADCDGDRVTLMSTRVLHGDDMIRLSIPAPVLHESRTDKDGVSVYDHPDMWRYTSTSVIERETRLLDAAERTVTAPVIPAVVDQILDAAAQRGRPLGEDQAHMVSALATRPHAIVTAVGPAGAGKTTAMRALAEAVQAQGGTVVGLAPSAVAARELGQAIGVDASTAHRWLAADGHASLRAGDVVLIDEAGMVDNRTLGEVADRALAAGAVVRMVGDPAQLGSVDAGGAFDLLHRCDPDPIELETIWRFKDPQEAGASLELRDGPALDAFAWYQDNDRVRGGAEKEILAEAHAAWRADTEAGRTSIIIASTTERVGALNDQIAAERAASGATTDPQHPATTRDGHALRLGDTILTRRNAPHLPYGGRGQFVRNGDLWTLTDIRPDGTLVATAADHSVVELPADYAAAHVQLGYAATVHRAQGVTVDTAHAVLDPAADRNLAYVALTRGRERNTAWLVVEDDQPTGAVLDTIASRSPDNPSVIVAQAQEWLDAGDPVRERDIYTDLVGTADRIRWAERLRQLAAGKKIPAQAARASASLAFKGLITRLNGLEAEGIDIDALLVDLTQDLGRPRDPAALLCWRINDWRGQHPTITDPDYVGPMSALDDRALADARRHAAAQADDAARRVTARDLAITDPDAPGAAPAWGNRPHGAMGDHELNQAIRDAVAESFAHAVDPAGPQDGLDEAARSLLAERDTRATMDRQRRRGEDIQRWALSHMGDLTDPESTKKVDMTALAERVDDSYDAALTLLAEATEETARRKWRLPQEDAAQPPASDGLTSWTAPAAALADSRTPKDWRKALATQRQILAGVIDHAGERALDHEAWAVGLPRPEGWDEADHRRAVGEIATYRATHRIGEHLPLADTASTGAHDEAPVRDLVKPLDQARATATPEARVLADAEAATAPARRRASIDDALRRARASLDAQRREAEAEKAQRAALAERARSAQPHQTRGRIFGPKGPRL